MPRKVQLLLLLLALLTLPNVWFAVETGETSAWIKVAVNLAFLYGLMAGSESARSILRFFAGVGCVFAGISLVIIATSGLMMTSLGLVGATSAGFGLLVSGFMVWCLGQEDVKAWIFRRGVRDDG